MTISTTPEPKWYSLSHHDRYRRLQKVRRVWFRSRRHSVHVPGDRRDQTVLLDGTWINDVPSFYLALGEAINGPNGYFGGELHGMWDCLTGAPGVWPPSTVRLSCFDEVRQALDGAACCRFYAEGFREAVAEDTGRQDLIYNGYLPDGGEVEIARRVAIYAAALAGEPFDSTEFYSYFDGIVEVFEQSRVLLVPDDCVVDGH